MTPGASKAMVQHLNTQDHGEMHLRSKETASQHLIRDPGRKVERGTRGHSLTATDLHTYPTVDIIYKVFAILISSR
jgi:hypothetical protein